MSCIKFQYRFVLDQDNEEIFDLELEGDARYLETSFSDDSPDWARLDFHQCPHCPLSTKTHTYCPVMANIAAIAIRLDRLISYDEIDLEITTAERRIMQRTTAQRGISSLVGLAMAASDCPHTRFFKPMAHFHLPLASEQETIFRAVSTYLVMQYLKQIDGEKGDFDLRGLNDIYANIHEVNKAIIERLRDSVGSDSSINALLILDMFAYAVPDVVNESLDEIKDIFTAYSMDDRAVPGAAG